MKHKDKYINGSKHGASHMGAGYDGDDDMEDDVDSGEYLGFDDDDDEGEGNELKAYSDKREERVKKIKRRRRHITAAAIFLVLFCIVCFNWSTLNPAALMGTVQDALGMGKNLYPVEFSDGTMKSAVKAGSNIGVLTDTSFLMYSQNGSEITSRPHGFNNPAAVSGGGKAVIYDSGGTQFRVETKLGEPYTNSNTGNAITSAAAGANGYFAIITESESYLSELKVYDNFYKNIFTWDASQGRVLTAALSPDGKRLAAVVTGARNGCIFSDIYIFSLNSKNPTAVRPYDDTILYSVRFLKDGSIAAVGRDKSVFLNSAGKQTSVYSYGGRTLNCFSNAEGPVVLIFANVGTARSYVAALDGNGRLLGDSNVAADIEGAAADSSNVVLASRGSLWHSGTDCKAFKKVSLKCDTLAVLTLKNYAYTFGSQVIDRCRLN